LKKKWRKVIPKAPRIGGEEKLAGGGG